MAIWHEHAKGCAWRRDVVPNPRQIIHGRRWRDGDHDSPNIDARANEPAPTWAQNGEHRSLKGHAGNIVACSWKTAVVLEDSRICALFVLYAELRRSAVTPISMSLFEHVYYHIFSPGSIFFLSQTVTFSRKPDSASYEQTTLTYGIRTILYYNSFSPTSFATTLIQQWPQ